MVLDPILFFRSRFIKIRSNFFKIDPELSQTYTVVLRTRACGARTWHSNGSNYNRPNLLFLDPDLF